MALNTQGNPGGTNQVGGATRTHYSRVLIATLFHWLAIVPFGLVRDIPMKEGQTTDWRAFGRLSAATTALTEGTPPAGSNLTVTSVTATVDQYGDFIEITDRLLDTGPDPYAIEILELQAQQAALTFDTLTQTAVFAGTNVTYAGNAAARNQIDSGDVFAWADLDTIVKALKARHVKPVTGFVNPTTGVATQVLKPAFVSIITPAIHKVMKGTANYATNFVGVEKYQANGPTFPNEIGAVDQIRFIESTNGYFSATGGSGSGPVHIMPTFGNGFFAISRVTGKSLVPMIRPIDTPNKGDELGQRGSIGWKGYFVAKILDQDIGQRYEFYGA